MTTLDERETAYEKRFANDRETMFRAEARCNRRVGLWAAALLGKTGEAAESYAAELVSTGVETGAAGVLTRLEADFDEAGVALTDTALSARMDDELAQALEALKAG